MAFLVIAEADTPKNRFRHIHRNESFEFWQDLPEPTQISLDEASSKPFLGQSPYGEDGPLSQLRFHVEEAGTTWD